KPVTLSMREFALLQHLLENVGRVIPRARLEQKLYGWQSEVESNSLEVFIHHLRKKLGSDLIRTVRGVGYMIEQLS
ncbi:MAG TPA: winged helix-turn-helix domain-containing protein, partial [Gammaproteobacteria bacterium]